MLLDPEIAHVLLDSLLAAFAALGGLMAFYTGRAANKGQRFGASPDMTTRWIHEAMAQGFREALFWGLVAAMIVAWT